VTKTDDKRGKAAEAFDKVRPEVRDLTAVALVEGMRATLSWLVGRSPKRKEEDQENV
jgi:hypothetical protein